MKWEQIYIYMCQENSVKGEVKVGEEIEDILLWFFKYGSF